MSETDSNASAAQFDWQRAMRTQLASATGGLAPEVYVLACLDWYTNLARRPATQWELAGDAAKKAVDSWTFAVNAMTGRALEPAQADARYDSDSWQRWPFNVYANTYKNYADWWKTALSSVPGVSVDNEQKLKLMGGNALEAVSPANYLATNPDLLQATRAESGQNLLRGISHWFKDFEMLFAREGAARQTEFVVGRDLRSPPEKSSCATRWSS